MLYHQIRQKNTLKTTSIRQLPALVVRPFRRVCCNCPLRNPPHPKHYQALFARQGTKQGEATLQCNPTNRKSMPCCLFLADGLGKLQAICLMGISGRPHKELLDLEEHLQLDNKESITATIACFIFHVYILSWQHWNVRDTCRDPLERLCHVHGNALGVVGIPFTVFIIYVFQGALTFLP